MPRRLCLPAVSYGWYYFVRRSMEARKIVSSNAEIELFRSQLSATLGQSGAHLHFAHVDEDVVHLALRAGEASLVAALGRFCQHFARTINRIRCENGPLFQPHVRFVLVQPGMWFLTLGRFIHWIPRVQLRVRDPTSLGWNTDSVYRNREKTRGLVTSLAFRSLSRRPRRQDYAYRAFFDQRPGGDEIETIRTGSAQDSRILGDPAFVSGVSRQLGLSMSRRALDCPDVLDKIRRATLQLTANFKALCGERARTGTGKKWQHRATLENVCSASRAQPLPMLRGLSATYLIRNRIGTLRQIESFFNCRPGTLSARRRRHYEHEFEQLFDTPCDQLFKCDSCPVVRHGSQPARPASGL
jgi:hypothetical protein